MLEILVALMVKIFYFLRLMRNFGTVADNVAKIQHDINRSLERSGREGTAVTIVAVTKTFPAEAVLAAISAGLSDVGENRVQETVSKKPEVNAACKWHLIGHLQKNKINKALELYDMIQSVDSCELAEAINARAAAPVDILLQVDSSGEETKFGFDPDELQDTATRIAHFEKIHILGLMTIGPLTDDKGAIRRSFMLTRSLFESLQDASIPNCEMKYLSMGMSDDYMIAVEEGSNMVRIGSAIFGGRG